MKTTPKRVNDGLLDYILGDFDYQNMPAADRTRCENVFNRYYRAIRDKAKGKIDRTAYNEAYNDWLGFVMSMDLKYAG